MQNAYKNGYFSADRTRKRLSETVFGVALFVRNFATPPACEYQINCLMASSYSTLIANLHLHRNRLDSLALISAIDDQIEKIC